MDASSFSAFGVGGVVCSSVDFSGSSSSVSESEDDMSDNGCCLEALREFV